MIIGYHLSGHDNDSYMLGNETRKAITPEEAVFFDWRFIKNGGQHPATCPKCGRKIDPEYLSPEFKLKMKTMDFSSTYDSYTIVSERFKKFCELHNLEGIEFVALPNHKQHFWFRVNSTLTVDLENSVGIRFLYYCNLCEKYAGVFGTSGVKFKEVTDSIPKGFSKSDLEFAQAHEQHSLILIDVDLANKIKAEKFKGVCLNKIEI